MVLGAPFVDFKVTFGLQGNREDPYSAFENETEESFLRKVRDYQHLISQKIERELPEKPEQQLLLALIHFRKLMETRRETRSNEEVFLEVEVYPTVSGRSFQGVVYTRNPFSGNQDGYGVYHPGLEGPKHPLNTLPKEWFTRLCELLPVDRFRNVMEVEFVTDDQGIDFILHSLKKLKRPRGRQS